VVSDATTLFASSTLDAPRARQVTLLDLLDRLLSGGIVIRGQITLAAADVDLVELDLALMVASVDKAAGR
jgi:Gas vesicle protein